MNNIENKYVNKTLKRGKGNSMQQAPDNQTCNYLNSFSVNHMFVVTKNHQILNIKTL
jgi:hypothetical protein